jgi:hypothetical protein
MFVKLFVGRVCSSNSTIEGCHFGREPNPCPHPVRGLRGPRFAHLQQVALSPKQLDLHPLGLNLGVVRGRAREQRTVVLPRFGSSVELSRVEREL